MRDPRQREILENYLINRQLTAAELDAFAGVFPNANFMISPNLLTPNHTPDRATLVARDAETLQVVQKWLADPRFAKQRPALEKISRRLEEFVRQANQGSEPRASRNAANGGFTPAIPYRQSTTTSGTQTAFTEKP